jgi:small subunit ribosomal protein S7
MRGRSRYKKRNLKPDIKYGSVTVAKFINYVLQEGKRSVAEDVVYSSFEEASKTMKIEPLEVFNKVIALVAPNVEVRSKRIGGANYQIPVDVKEPRRTALAMRWIIESAKSKKGKPMKSRLAEVYKESIEGTGAAIKKRTDVQKMAEANKAFAHFARSR